MTLNSNGIVVSTLEDRNVADANLLKDLQGDPTLNARFRANPGENFKSIGIPSDGIKEVMTDLHLTEEVNFDTDAYGCPCLWTNCQCTDSAQAIML